MRFVDRLQNITNYEAGKPIELVVREYGIEPKDIIKLASNENPYGASPLVHQALKEHLEQVYLYPDDSMYALKGALCEHFGIERANLVIGSGSDEVIKFAIEAKASDGGAILINGITFAMYEIYAKQVGATVIRTPSRVHDLDAFYDLYSKHRPDVIFLCTPNNPTGDALDVVEMERFLERIDEDTLVVIDGAYMEYAAYKDAKKYVEPAKLLTRFDNVLYLGTFSKAYGLGGMRIGYGIAQAPIIQALQKLRPPFNITTLSLVAAKAALSDQAHVQTSVQKNFEQMRRYEALADAKGLEYIPSHTNFITLLLNRHQAAQLATTLLKKGLIVRDLSSYALNAIRITVGTSTQNDRLLEELEQLL